MAVATYPSHPSPCTPPSHPFSSVHPSIPKWAYSYKNVPLPLPHPPSILPLQQNFSQKRGGYPPPPLCSGPNPSPKIIQQNTKNATRSPVLVSGQWGGVVWLFHPASPPARQRLARSVGEICPLSIQRAEGPLSVPLDPLDIKTPGSSLLVGGRWLGGQFFCHTPRDTVHPSTSRRRRDHVVVELISFFFFKMDLVPRGLARRPSPSRHRIRAPP